MNFVETSTKPEKDYPFSKRRSILGGADPEYINKELTQER